MRRKIDIRKFPKDYKFLVTDRAVELIKAKAKRERWGDTELSRKAKEAALLWGRNLVDLSKLSSTAVTNVLDRDKPDPVMQSKLIPYLLLGVGEELTFDLVLPCEPGETALIVDEADAWAFEAFSAYPELRGLLTTYKQRLHDRGEESR